MNILSLNEVLELLYGITNMRVTLSNSSYRGLISFPGFQINYCKEIQKSKECHSVCRRSDKQSFDRAAETNEVYCYTCPFGLVEIVAPISANNKIVGYIMAGQAIKATNEAEKNVLDILNKHCPAVSNSYGQIIAEIPRVTEAQLKNYCKLLTMATQYIECSEICHFEGKSLGSIIKNYIRDNFENPITLELLAHNLRCSTSTITGTFRKEFGKTVMQYVKEKRMEYARELLMDHEISIKEAALRCGFSDSGYFTKTFTQLYGFSPTEWRREHLVLRVNK